MTTYLERTKGKTQKVAEQIHILSGCENRRKQKTVVKLLCNTKKRLWGLIIKKTERVKENFITNTLRLLNRWDLNRWSNRNQNKKFNQFYETFRACIRKDLEKERKKSFLLVATAKFILQIIKKIRASNFNKRDSKERRTFLVAAFAHF